MESVQVRAADGRALEVQSDGPADGRAVLFQVGTPAAGILYPPLMELGTERGLRHIAYSRPGYGDGHLSILLDSYGRLIDDLVAMGG